MTPEKKKELQLFAVRARKNVIVSLHAAGSGHPGGSLSSIDYLTYLYTEEMRNLDPKDPRKADRDRFVLSKGHICPGLYAVLAQCGFFPEKDLLTLRQPGSHLQGHPNMNLTPGVDLSTGSLGQGVSAAAGMAKGAKYLGQDTHVFALTGDGEIAEGQIWEALAFAAHYKLDNLCVAMDINGLQIDGATKDVMNMEPIDKKVEAFGWDVIKINGHDFDDIEKAFERFHANLGTGKPTAILMNTVKGKGVSFMENQAGWHGKAPNDKEFEQAMAELDAAEKEIEEA